MQIQCCEELVTFVITSYRRSNNSGMLGCDTFRDKATSKAASGCRTSGPSSSECKTVLKGRNHDGGREDPWRGTWLSFVSKR
ncbi:hypothetical protein HPB50_014605 [Hyalomma asiaticum]|uniref:Uncharacterized protein n=1 Tax=Hyalomma asiaticum TaxID=266040 RepID=A0ACB7RXC5_HYAAI|nr:hypothetical protein HPB50_014605 [Hyalomma asiaticum]